MEIPKASTLDAVFGFDHDAYPKMDDIPEEHRTGRSNGCKVFSSLFFRGGKLADHGLRVKEGTDSVAFHTALRGFMGSFAPKHELKEATCAWFIDTHTEPVDE